MLTLLVGVEGREVAGVEGQLRDVGLRARRIPLLRKGEGLCCQRRIILHLYREFETLAVEPFLIEDT